MKLIIRRRRDDAKILFYSELQKIEDKLQTALDLNAYLLHKLLLARKHVAWAVAQRDTTEAHQDLERIDRAIGKGH